MSNENKLLAQLDEVWLRDGELVPAFNLLVDIVKVQAQLLEDFKEDTVNMRKVGGQVSRDQAKRLDKVQERLREHASTLLGIQDRHKSECVQTKSALSHIMSLEGAMNIVIRDFYGDDQSMEVISIRGVTQELEKLSINVKHIIDHLAEVDTRVASLEAGEDLGQQAATAASAEVVGQLQSELAEFRSQFVYEPTGESVYVVCNRLKVQITNVENELAALRKRPSLTGGPDRYIFDRVAKMLAANELTTEQATALLYPNGGGTQDAG